MNRRQNKRLIFQFDKGNLATSVWKPQKTRAIDSATEQVLGQVVFRLDTVVSKPQTSLTW